jgi:hypothetical protein
MPSKKPLFYTVLAVAAGSILVATYLYYPSLYKKSASKKAPSGDAQQNGSQGEGGSSGSASGSGGQSNGQQGSQQEDGQAGQTSGGAQQGSGQSSGQPGSPQSGPSQGGAPQGGQTGQPAALPPGAAGAAGGPPQQGGQPQTPQNGQPQPQTDGKKQPALPPPSTQSEQKEKKPASLWGKIKQVIQQTVVAVVRMVPAHYREQWGLNQLISSAAPEYSGSGSETISGDGSAPDQQGNKPQAESNQQQMSEKQKTFHDLQEISQSGAIAQSSTRQDPSDTGAGSRHGLKDRKRVAAAAPRQQDAGVIAVPGIRDETFQIFVHPRIRLVHHAVQDVLDLPPIIDVPLDIARDPVAPG